MLAWDDELTAGDIARNFKMSRPAVSQHLGVLVDSNLITVRRDATRRLYLANRETLHGLKQALAPFWEDRLMKLQSAAEAAQRKGRRK